MSFLKSISGDTETRSLENPSVDLSSPEAFNIIFGGGTGSFADEIVTEQTALAVPAVWAAVNFIASKVAELPLNVFRKTADGREKVESGTLNRIVHDVVNDDLVTSYEFRKQLMTRLLLSGRSFTFIERNKAGGVMNLWSMDAAATTVRLEGGRRVYEYRRKDGRTEKYAASEVIDLAYMHAADGISHVSPLHVGRNAIGLAIAAERFASRVFENGGVPALSLKGPTMSPATASRMTEDFQDLLKSTRDKKRNVLAVPNGFSLEPIGLKAIDMQVLDLRKFAILEIARIFAIPPIFIQDHSASTYSNTEQQDLNLAKHTIARWVEQIEQELNAKLTGPRNRDLYVEFNMDGLMRGDFVSRQNGYSIAINAGILTPNEARAIENRPALPGGDDLMIQGATVPITLAGKDPKAAPAPTTTPAEETTAPADGEDAQ